MLAWQDYIFSGEGDEKSKAKWCFGGMRISQNRILQISLLAKYFEPTTGSGGTWSGSERKLPERKEMQWIFERGGASFRGKGIVRRNNHAQKSHFLGGNAKQGFQNVQVVNFTNTFQFLNWNTYLQLGKNLAFLENVAFSLILNIFGDLTATDYNVLKTQFRYKYVRPSLNYLHPFIICHLLKNDQYIKSHFDIMVLVDMVKNQNPNLWRVSIRRHRSLL